MSKPEDRFPVDVCLKSRALTDEELRRVRGARKIGWFIAKGKPRRRQIQQDAWFLFCHENSADYVCFDEREDGLWLESQKTHSLPLSRIFAQEMREFCARWEVQDITRVRIPKRVKLSEFAEGLLALYARDRTTERALQLERSAYEGLAEVVNPEKYWPDLEGHPAYAYVIPIPGKPGRCVALGHQRLPLVDVPLSDFRLLDGQL